MIYASKNERESARREKYEQGLGLIMGDGNTQFHVDSRIR